MTLPPFQRLVDDHWRDVARLAHALAGPVDGDDAAQQAWIQALAAYSSLKSARNLRGWLLTITSRCAMDVHRARSRRAVPAGDIAAVAEMAALSGSHGSAARSGPAGRTAVAGPDVGRPDELLWSKVAGLPERQRHAVVLKYVADLDHRTIAQALDTTPAMSRRLVSDGLAALRKAI